MLDYLRISQDFIQYIRAIVIKVSTREVPKKCLLLVRRKANKTQTNLAADLVLILKNSKYHIVFWNVFPFCPIVSFCYILSKKGKKYLKLFEEVKGAIL